MNKDKEFQDRVKQTLDRQQLSDEVRRDLQAARIAALDSAAPIRSRHWMPATALASLLLVVGGFMLYQGTAEVGLPQAAVEDMAVIASDDEFELLEEFEFYVWLEQEDRV